MIVVNCNSYNIFSLESFVKDVSIFGVISVAEVHYSTRLATGAELQTDISQPQLTRKTTVDFQIRDEAS
jgi:hypothetical protein